MAQSPPPTLGTFRQDTGKTDDTSLSDNAPGRTARRMSFGGFQVVERSVIIAASRHAAYQHCRHAEGLNRILGPDLQVSDPDPQGVIWALKAPNTSLQIETKLIAEREDEFLAWRAVEAAALDIDLKLQFREAIGARGTEVEVTLAYRPQWGLPGVWAARLRGIEPKRLVSHALKRLKMLLETGEIATANNRRT